MQPSHLHINKDIMDVLLNSSEFHLKSMMSIIVSLKRSLKTWEYDFVFILTDLHAVGHIVESLRVVKSPAEISIMKKCANITAHGFMKVEMEQIKRGIEDYFTKIIARIMTSII